jgi:hypothetical protein
VWIPYVWVRFDGLNHEHPTDPTYVSLTWDNGKHGWFTGDFIAGTVDTHESLLVTASIITHPDKPDGQIAAGNVVDPTGASFPLDSSGLVPLPKELIRATDLLPSADLGVLTPGQSKSFDFTFTYHWGSAGSGDLGAYRTAGYGVILDTVPPDANHNPGIPHRPIMMG